MLRWRHGAAFVLLAGTASHLLFSWMGFNPTDEGFTLAATRRLLDGEIPHRDFISIRPAGPYLTYLPVMIFGGDYVIWLSRWVAWLQLALVGWCWVAAFDRWLVLTLNPTRAAAVAFTAFAMSAHDYPVMAWHSLDAMAATAAGVALVSTRRRRAATLGYAALGAACLSRQNYLPMAPAMLLLTGDWRSPRCMAAAAAPVTIMAAVLAAAGALPDAMSQLLAKHDLRTVGIIHYLDDNALPWTLNAGYWGMALLFGDVRAGRTTDAARTGRLFGLLLLAGLSYWAAFELRTESYPHLPSFALFGAVAGACLNQLDGLAARPHAVLTGAVLYAFTVAMLAGLRDPLGAAALAAALLAARVLLAARIPPAPRDGTPPERGNRSRVARTGLLAVAGGWCASISVGYNSPALMAGPLAVLLLAWPFAATRWSSSLRWMRGTVVALAGLQAATAGIAFGLTRCRNIYRDRPAWQLTAPLGGILPGGRLLRTNPATAAYLADLAALVARLGPTPYAIVPDTAAHWVRSARRNPLPIDWAEGFTLMSPDLFGRVARALDATPGLMILVPKVSVEELASGYYHVPDDQFHMMAAWVRSRYRRAGGSSFFEVYRNTRK